MQKLVTFVLLSFLFVGHLEAGVLKGRKVYETNLKESCGFTGDVMGQKYSAQEWKDFYSNKTLAKVLKKECPKSKILTNQQDLRSLVSFFVMFAKGTGNKAACGN
ncbi:MAG TPA: hypothetical protein CFH82_11435 [Sulfurospirillum sp. UBA12182]|jgi:hypothetical protein|nr:MAG TPA: hypothetical protein CFH82_11435 [Sulfurospirillum sp. UBA12182]